MAQPQTSAQGAIHFQVLAQIAVGTTARLDLCRADSPPHLAGRLLAVKRLHQHIAEDPSFANQFLDEVWMTASLKHPNVVEVAGWGNDDEGMYLAVELVQGVSLARLMKTIFDTGEAFTERMVVFIASQLCRGLAAAHSLRAQNGELLQLVHRDLTPGNVLVSFGGDLKIADFGLAKAKQRLTKTLTGLLKGQPQYMAPEQARGDVIDHRTDLFALGVLMFELFAGRKPWVVASDFDAVQAILVRPADDLRELRPKIDKELATVVHRSLEKDPAARFQSANEIQARLDEWLLVHGYQEGNEEALGRFVRRNAMRQMRWFERAVAGELTEGRPEPPRAAELTGANPKAVLTAAAQHAAMAPRGAAAARHDEPEETDVTEIESMVAEMHQRAGDPATARKMAEDRDYSEEVPTIVQKSGTVPIKPRAGAAARLAPGTRPPSRPPPHPPPGRLGQQFAPAPGALRPPPIPAGRQGAVVPRPPATAPQQPAARVLPRPPAPAAGSAARPLPIVPEARGMHESIIDEESDARTTAVKARPRAALRAPVIVTPPREPAPSISDPETEEVPTLPLKGMPPSLRAGRGAAAAGPLPGQIAPNDPRVPPPPGSQPSLPSLQAVEDDWPASRGPINEERLFAEADRLALEAVRFSDEAKVSAARAERHGVIAKIAGDAAAIAVEAVRLTSTGGFAEAARRLEDAYALELTIRRLTAAAPDAAPPAAPPPQGSHNRLITARLPSGGIPAQSPRSGSREREREPQPSYAPSSAAGPVSSPSNPMTQSSNPMQGGGTPMQQPMRSDSLLPAPPNTQGAGGFEAFEARLRPTIFGLPGLHVAALAIGTFVLVLVLMWILMG